MEHQEREQNQNRAINEIESRYGPFTRKMNCQIHTPIAEREHSERTEDHVAPLVPMVVQVEKSGFDLAMTITGWLISLATFGVVALYTYYARASGRRCAKLLRQIPMLLTPPLAPWTRTKGNFNKPWEKFENRLERKARAPQPRKKLPKSRKTLCISPNGLTSQSEHQPLISRTIRLCCL